jgi:hypothetical protein
MGGTSKIVLGYKGSHELKSEAQISKFITNQAMEDLR